MENAKEEMADMRFIGFGGAAGIVESGEMEREVEKEEEVFLLLFEVLLRVAVLRV